MMPKFAGHKYTYEKPFGSARHNWHFRGPEGGVQFTASIYKENPSCGLEFHHHKQPYGEPEAAHHAPCWLTGQPCWHDGTSLYANEKIWPLVKGYLQLGDHEEIFRLLEHEYELHFDRIREHADDEA